MVTSAGFNALLKVVEEPPENVMFIFATTEPEKVIGTIRSRTHHFPFRLIPPAPMLEYVEEICAAEGVTAQPGVLPLVVRAGGGSARDTMSLLDQLIAGTDGAELQYELATQLLGFTSQGLLNDAIDAFAAGDAASAYRSVDAVIQSGQDPRRYVEDLLERVRDLIVVRALGESASSVLRGVAPDDLEQMRGAAGRFSPRSLSQMADIVNETLTEMSGVTAPRVQLELMVARILVAMRADFAGDAGFAGQAGSTQADARQTPQRQTPAAPPVAPTPAQRPVAQQPAAPAPAVQSSAAQRPAAQIPAAQIPTAQIPTAQAPTAQAPIADRTPVAQSPAAQSPANPAADAAAAWDAVAPSPSPALAEQSESAPADSAQTGLAHGEGSQTKASQAQPVSAMNEPTDSGLPARSSQAAPQSSVAQGAAHEAAAPKAPVNPHSFDLARVRAAWPEVIEQIGRDGHRSAAAIVKMLAPLEYGPGDGVGNLRVEVPNRGVMEQLARGREQNNAPANHLKTALTKVFGFEVLIHPRVLKDGEQSAVQTQDAPPADPDRHRAVPSGRDEGRSPSAPRTGAESRAAAERNQVNASAAVSATAAGLTSSPAATAAPEPVPVSPRAPAAPASPSPEAKVATWDVVAIPGSEDGPGSGWDELASDASASTSATTAAPSTAAAVPSHDDQSPEPERIVEVIAAKEAAAMEPEPRASQPDASSLSTAPRGSGAGRQAAVPSQTDVAANRASTRNVTSASVSQPEPAAVRRHPALAAGNERYGESVVRERLGARFVGEEEIEFAEMMPGEMASGDVPPPDDFDAPPPPEEF